MAETRKAYERRKRANFFAKYCRGAGIDIGCGDDPLKDEAIYSLVKYDTSKMDASYIIGDATGIKEFSDEQFDFVYSSHCLEHLQDYRVVLRNWFRILKSGGYLLLLLPHRDYYEGKKQLPSVHNTDHKVFFLPFIAEPPDTISVYALIQEALGANVVIIYLNECSETTSSGDREYSIEVVIKK
jgi:SAM-dependent methyltransferase